MLKRPKGYHQPTTTGLQGKTLWIDFFFFFLMLSLVSAVFNKQFQLCGKLKTGDWYGHETSSRTSSSALWSLEAEHVLACQLTGCSLQGSGGSQAVTRCRQLQISFKYHQKSDIRGKESCRDLLIPKENTSLKQFSKRMRPLVPQQRFSIS